VAFMAFRTFFSTADFSHFKRPNGQVLSIENIG